MKNYEYKIKSIENIDGKTLIILKHADDTHTEVVFASTGIGMWYKDAEYAEIDFPKLEKIYRDEEE